MSRDERAIIAEQAKIEDMFRDMMDIQAEMDRVQLEDYENYEEFLNRDF